MKILDPRFKYVPSTKTDITATWRKHGFRPTTESERRARERERLNQTHQQERQR